MGEQLEIPRRLPTGVVTFPLTDVEGWARLWEGDGDAMAATRPSRRV